MMLLTVASPCQALPQNPKPYGGTLRWGFYHKPSPINPFFTTQTISASLIQLIYNGLVRINPQGEIEPDLAQSWDISENGLVYTFHLRRGVRFHDGTECTARDVKFTYDAIMDPALKSPFRESFQTVDRFEVMDRYTLTVTLKETSISFLTTLPRYVVPEHTDIHAINSHPVGTGPFKFREWTKDDQIILDFNPDYYEGRPYLDRIVAKSYPNSDNLWAGLMRDEVDCVLFIGQKDYEVVRNDPSFKAYAIAIDGYYALAYNLDDPLLKDRRTREAIAYAVDRKGLISRAAGGYGLECRGPFNPQSLGFNPDVAPFAYDPQKAQVLLRELGWQDKDNDGILEKNGEKLELKILVDSRNAIYKRIIMVLRQQLQQVGIRITVQLSADDNVLSEEVLKQNKIQGRLTFFLAGGDPDQEAYAWSSGESKRMNQSRRYRNEEVDKLFKQGRIVKDSKERKRIYQKIHRIIYQDQPACFLYFPVDFHAVSAKFENTDLFFNINMPNYTIKDFYLKEDAPT